VAINHDSEVAGAVNTTAGNYDTAITPNNTPQAVCAIIIYNSVSDLVTSITYGTGAGAVTLTRQRWDTEATEAGSVMIYWAAGTFPTGVQTVRVVRTGTTSMRVQISTMTTSIPASFGIDRDADATGTSAGVANPSWTLATAASVNTVCYEGIHSGLTTMTSTPASGWTLQTSEDYGAQGRGWARRTFTGGNLTCGWTASTSDDFVGSSISFKEIPAPISGGGRQPHMNRRAANRAAVW
jgi:hypothetical protein